MKIMQFSVVTISLLFSMRIVAQDSCSSVNEVTQEQFDCSIEILKNTASNTKLSQVKALNLCREYSLGIENIMCGVDLSPRDIKAGIELCISYTRDQLECGKDLNKKVSSLNIKEAVSYCASESQKDINCSLDLSDNNSMWIPNSFKDNLTTCKKYSGETIECAVGTSSLLSTYGFNYNLMLCHEYDYETVKCVGNISNESSFGKLITQFFDTAALCKSQGEKVTRCAVKYAEDNSSVTDLISTTRLKENLKKGFVQCNMVTKAL
ncbi:hypothetical protein [Halobacteriovorax sp. RT-2-6]|uniref:hypothetical protein n=1 Tax=unclassified Halobacteriovorax TaxID=2639665 RepID=UPI00399A6A2A